MQRFLSEDQTDVLEVGLIGVMPFDYSYTTTRRHSAQHVVSRQRTTGRTNEENMTWCPLGFGALLGFRPVVIGGRMAKVKLPYAVAYVPETRLQASITAHIQSMIYGMASFELDINVDQTIADIR